MIEKIKNSDVIVNIKKLMEQQNIDIKQLSSDTEINFNTLSGYINSGKNIPLRSLVKIAHRFNVYVSYLIGDISIANLDDKDMLCNSFIKIINEYKASSK